MSRRMSEQVIDRGDRKPQAIFVGEPPNGEPARFEVKLVPLAPDVKVEIRQRPDDGGTLREVVDMHLGCPNCHEDINFRWQVEEVGRSTLRDLASVLHAIRSLEFSLAILVSESPTARKLLDVAERLHAALRPF